MRRLKLYENFLKLLSESHLTVDDEFKKVILSARSKSSIANSLYSLINKDVQTNANYLSLGKENDEVIFTNDKQVARIVQSGQDPFKVSRNNSKIGRLVRQILVANNMEVTDKKIEDFVNVYKSNWDGINSPGNFEIVKGDKIKFWYLFDNYEQGSGTLSGSCMRYSKCQDFFGIYTDNPDSCSLVILKSPDGTKLLARALLWKIEDIDADLYLDRIYTIKDYDQAKLLNWTISQFPDKKIISYQNNDPISKISVPLENVIFDKYPYMDSLPYINVAEKKLVSSLSNKQDLFFQCQDTGGVYATINQVYSKIHKKYIKQSESFWVQSMADYVHITDCYPEIRSTKKSPMWVYKPEAVYSELYKGYFNKKDSVDTKWGIVPRYELVDVDTNGLGLKEKIPLKAFGNTYCHAFDYRTHGYFVRTEDTFKDLLGIHFMNGSKSKLLSTSDITLGILKMAKVGTRGLVKLGNTDTRKIFYHFGRLNTENTTQTVQVWGIEGTDIPLALEYSDVPGIYSPLDLAISFDLEILDQKELYLNLKNFTFDAFDRFPIYNLDRIESNPSAQIIFLEWDRQMMRRSGTYVQNKDFLAIAHLSEEERFKIFNKTIENSWIESSVFKKWIFNFRTQMTSPKNSDILNRILGYFNRKRPFGVNRRYNVAELIDWFEANLDKILCYFFIWHITYDRYSSSKMASEYFQDFTENTREWLNQFTFTDNSFSFGDEVYNTIEVDDDRLDGYSGKVSRWARRQLVRANSINNDYNNETDEQSYNYPNIIPVLDKFRLENLPNLLKKV